MRRCRSADTAAGVSARRQSAVSGAANDRTSPGAIRPVSSKASAACRLRSPVSPTSPAASERQRALADRARRGERAGVLPGVVELAAHEFADRQRGKRRERVPGGAGDRLDAVSPNPGGEFGKQKRVAPGELAHSRQNLESAPGSAARISSVAPASSSAPSLNVRQRTAALTSSSMPRRLGSIRWVLAAMTSRIGRELIRWRAHRPSGARARRRGGRRRDERRRRERQEVPDQLAGFAALGHRGRAADDRGPQRRSGAGALGVAAASRGDGETTGARLPGGFAGQRALAHTAPAFDQDGAPTPERSLLQRSLDLADLYFSAYRRPRKQGSLPFRHRRCRERAVNPLKTRDLASERPRQNNVRD